MTVYRGNSQLTDLPSLDYHSRRFSAASIVVIIRQLTIQHHLLYVVQHDAFMPIWPLSTRM